MSPIRRRDARRGTAAVEFALVAPLLVLLAIGTAEMVVHLRTWFRLERTAAEVANVASQAETLAEADVNALFDAARMIAAPILAWSSGDGTAFTMISVVAGTANGGNRLCWTRSRGTVNGGNLVAGQGTLPNGFQVPAGQSVLVVEIVNRARPWSVGAASLFLGSAGPVRSYAILRPRLASLTNLDRPCP
ncbi:TadE/TadG family type IV pilus assembly protein [Paracraurococcus ruber]|uniref:TadE-like domain-containing protein n=1 Tax=Paracraurococcus ruber TaxID=77675 RepID=A0ABS1CVE7_9PROT|nr:TadE/TadG family type IV pilus assembly protein [Paracraurococcus ruber]MBK1658374.1 hypothetical protein [Paracraurococcus ruber]TDG30578.1 hypothetical protein E2C05_14025 [Paracraurococcus ruber]